MHELSFASALLEIVEDTARREQASRVTGVVLEVGVLAALALEPLRFCFDAVTRGTVAEGATLEVIEVPGEGRCARCEKTVAITSPYDACPTCGEGPVPVTRGNEMRVKSIQVE